MSGGDANLVMVIVVLTLFVLCLYSALYVDLLDSRDSGRTDSVYIPVRPISPADVAAMLVFRRSIVLLELRVLAGGARQAFWAPVLIGAFAIGTAGQIAQLLLRVAKGLVEIVVTLARLARQPRVSAGLRLVPKMSNRVRHIAPLIFLPVLLWNAFALAAFVDNLAGAQTFGGLLQQIEGDLDQSWGIAGRPMTRLIAICGDAILALIYVRALLTAARALVSLIALAVIVAGLGSIAAALAPERMLDLFPAATTPQAASLLVFGLVLLASGLAVARPKRNAATDS